MTRKLITMIVLLLSSATLFAEKTYDLAIAAIFKNEGSYLKEWIEYHMLVGVQHFYLYNNGSTDNYKRVLEPYIRRRLVTVIDWPDQNPKDWNDKQYKWVYCTQIPAYEHCISGLAKEEARWLAMIDIDEFLVPAQKATMTEVLAEYFYEAGLCVYWQVYGTSNVQDLSPNTLLIESLTMTAHDTHPLNISCPKMIVRPEAYYKFTWPPHFCVLAHGRRPKELSKDVAQLNHYVNRTVNFFLDHKVKSKEHMNNRKLSDGEIAEWLSMGNDVHDEKLIIFRYVPELRKRMGFICN